MNIKKMSKVLCLLLVLLLLAGCGSSNEETVPTQTTTPTEATETQATTEATQATDSESTASDKPIYLGVLENGLYTNQYVKVSCEFDALWKVYQAHELQQLPENVQDMFEGTQIAETLKSHPQIYDMMADDQTNLRSMNILYVSLSLSEQLIYDSMDDDALIDTMLDTQQDLLIDSYTAAGIQVGKLEKKTMTFLGQERAVLYLEGTEMGVPRYTVQIFDYTLGQYGVTITFTSYKADQTQSMMDMFSPA